MESDNNSLTNVFAYGSNLCVERLLARVPSASPLMAGYVTGRRLVFHKLGHDGSGKADASHSGIAEDRVWGVVYAVNKTEMKILDQIERGYDCEEMMVQGSSRSLTAFAYIARAESIAESLKPYSWYHQFVIRGAHQHHLPAEYIEHLKAFGSIPDPDDDRHQLNTRLLKVS